MDFLSFALVTHAEFRTLMPISSARANFKASSGMLEPEPINPARYGRCLSSACAANRLQRWNVICRKATA